MPCLRLNGLLPGRGPGAVRLRAVGVVAALLGVAMLGASSREQAVGRPDWRRSPPCGRWGVAVRTIAMLAGFAWTRRAMTRLQGHRTWKRHDAASALLGAAGFGADGAAGFGME